MRIKPLESKIVVVLVGNFNPRIFLPSWFAKNDVIGEEEGEKADIEVVHKEITKFSLTWLTVLVEQRRFIVEASQPPDIRLSDFVQKTFGELLIHTPIWAMGINKRVVFDAGSIDHRDKIGMTLAPPDAWGEWAGSIRKKSNTTRGGMVSISMRQSIVEDRPGGYIQTRVEPYRPGEPAVFPSESAVFVEVNDHYEIAAKEKVEGCQEIIELFAQNFENSTERSDWIIDQVMGIVK